MAFAAIPIFALLAIALGKEAGWDFQNYHWYDPYALLNGRLGFDIAVAHHATYYNPLIDVPLYWLGSHFPGWTAGLWLGAQAGVAAALLGAIAYRLIPLEDERARLAVAVVLAVAGMTGGGAWGEIGKTSDDIAAGLGIMASILVLVSGFGRVVRAQSGDLAGILAPAGFLAGISPGLKLTSAPYVVGLAVALMLLPGTPGRRIARTSAFSIGAAVGVAVFGGYWLWTMWRFSGNPLFPYFNDIFASPLVPPGSYRDGTFLPNDWLTRLTFPFVFSADSMKVAEWQFRDIHIAIVYVVAPLAALASLLDFRPPGKLVEPLAARLVLVMAAVTYILWLALFAIYRYLVPLEMLSPIIIALAVALLPLSTGLRFAMVALLLLGAQVMASPGNEPRLGWKGHYVEVSVPVLPDPAHTLILMTETASMAYVIPSFPPEIPFLRIQGWLLGSKDTTSGFGAEMHRRASEHKGPIYVLYWPVEEKNAVGSLADYGFAMDKPHCAPVPTNVGMTLDDGMPFQLCPLTRITP